MEENVVENGLDTGEGNNVETTEVENNPEDATNEKLFTQEQVNEIVRKRLGRQKEEIANIETRAAELSAREKRLDCREYLIQNNYSSELLDILDTSDVKEFKKKADKLSKMINKPNYEVAPLASVGDSFHFTPEKKFGSNTKHEPKGYWATDPR